nr:MAG TPA: hypothetical protein [Caudoviricetes sp.]
MTSHKHLCYRAHAFLYLISYIVIYSPSSELITRARAPAYAPARVPILNNLYSYILYSIFNYSILKKLKRS